MKRLITIAFMLGMLLLQGAAVFAQNKGNQVSSLTQAQIDKANKVRYDINSGSLPPEYWWGCIVIAEPTKVRLRVEGEYGEKVLYDRTFNVSAAQWKAFKSGLAKRKVRNDSRVDPMSGAQGGFLEVSANGKLLFRAVESDGLKYDGSLLDAYKVLLPKGKPQKILDDPSTILPQI